MISIFETNELTEKYIKNEDKQCKWAKVHGVVPEETDMLRNYRLVTYPNKKNYCYVRRDDPLVEGNCSKDNENLYNQDYKNVVDSIKPLGLADTIAAESVPQSVCGIKFKKRPPPKEVQSYLKYLDRNGQRFRAVSGEINELRYGQRVYQSQITYEQGLQAGYRKEVSKLDGIIKEKQDVLNARNKDLTEVNDIYRNLAAEINRINQSIKGIQDEYERRRP